MAIGKPRRFARPAGRVLCLGAVAALLPTVPAAAQSWPTPPPAFPTPEEADPVAETARLNREQAAFAGRQLAANEESRRAREEAVTASSEEMARQRSAYQAEKERRERDHAGAMARWRADVEACKAGDRSKCAAE